MKTEVLYYLEPMVEADYPYMKYVNLKNQLRPHINAMLRSGDFNVSVICSDITKGRYSKDKLKDEFNIYEIEYAELNDRYPSHINYSSMWKFENYKEEDYLFISEKIRNSLPEKYSPRVIISFLSFVPYLKKMYPNALILNMEYGIFSREPYPKTYHLDKDGLMEFAYTNKLGTLPDLSKSEMELVEIIKGKKERTEKISDIFLKKIKKEGFKSSILLPLQFSNYHAFDLCCNFSSQYTYLENVLRSVPSDIAVIVTQHPGWKDAISAKNISYLNDKYSNFIFDSSINSQANVSQSLLKYVDGVVTVSSSIGLQALIYDLPIYVFGNSHISFASEENIEDFTRKVIKKEKVNRDKQIFNLMTRYYIPDVYLSDSYWVSNYLHQMILNDQESNSCSYPQIDSLENLKLFYLSSGSKVI
ncbi:hypothetical protein [Enterovibrio norvegicus]|uniref:capsular polysaccharide export protein, LipB/KpsS family n=1 Tax=Enterovibrio norvegicus TaxID=188144 RepID=UPI0003084F13|nr:hypothetical protein [Enterovibrio norvegicus]OEF58599.1 hypothetical protein A1OU_10570 [Enterovibrio norvegicus]